MQQTMAGNVQDELEKMANIEKHSEEWQNLRAYTMHETSAKRNDATVFVSVTHNLLRASEPELRVEKHWTIGELKNKLWKRFGTSPDNMELQMFTADNKIMLLIEDHRMFGYYSPVDGTRLHIVDNNPYSIMAGGALEDVSLIKKYEISEKDYDEREDNFRKFKAMKLAEDPNWTFLPPQPVMKSDQFTGQAEAKQIKVGDRCEVFPGAKRGEVKFVGAIDGLPLGWWIGVQLDEPTGKNDGSVQGQKIFECAQGYGVFVRPDKCTVGDFPEEGLFSDDEL